MNPGRTRGELVAQRAAYSCAHRIVANYEAAAEQLKVEGVPTRRVSVVPNGIDFEGHVKRHASVSKRRRVVTVANLRPEKGYDVLLDAAARVRLLYPDATFELIGGGTELAALRARAQALGLTEAVTFAGHSDDIPARLGAADIFVLPSRSEAFPNAVLEAMASGLPVIASAVGGVLEMVNHERTGLLVPPDDPTALAAELCRLMSDSALASALGAAAAAEAARYTFSRMVSSFDAIYCAELARRGRVAAGRPDLATS